MTMESSPGDERYKKFLLDRNVDYYKNNPAYWDIVHDIVQAKTLAPLSCRLLLSLCRLGMKQVGPHLLPPLVTSTCMAGSRCDLLVALARVYRKHRTLYTERWFAVFATRTERLKITLHDKTITTSIRQLNFFRVLASTGILSRLVSERSRLLALATRTRKTPAACVLMVREPAHIKRIQQYLTCHIAPPQTRKHDESITASANYSCH
jgi:hypothetical protein